jgi:hypothetical protein
MLFEPRRKETVAAAARVGGRILDVGIGTGNSLSQYPRTVRVFGMDNWARRQARERRALQAVMGLSDRRACRIKDADRTLIRYRSQRAPDTALRTQLRDLLGANGRGSVKAASPKSAHPNGGWGYYWLADMIGIALNQNCPLSNESFWGSRLRWFKMADSDAPDVLLQTANSAIETAREHLKSLCEQWALNNPSAKEIARFDLCTALVRRLEIAQRELTELSDLIELK